MKFQIIRFILVLLLGVFILAGFVGGMIIKAILHGAEWAEKLDNAMAEWVSK